MSNAKKVDYFERISTFGRRISIPFREIYVGATTGAIPWEKCFVAVAIIQLAFAFHLEYLLAVKMGFRTLYPRAQWLYILYYYSWLASPFICWGVYRAVIASRLKARLTDVFKDIGLQSKAGKLPNLIYDVPLDQVTRKLRLTKRSLTPADFEKAKPALESALHVFIDQIRDDREKGAIDIIYAHSPMPETFTVKEYKNYHRWEFTVGTTRAKIVRSTLTDIPHILVAGQTGGGKSTFLRHFITSLYLSDQKAEFTLIDLKGGLEFQTFEKLKRVEVAGDIGTSLACLSTINEMVDDRFKLLRDNSCKDIGQYLERNKTASIPLNRQIVVVDEAAELFLTNSLAAPSDVRTAKEVLSRISRLGRSLGIHLVVATQRPDSRALDPQIKANLPGVLCFQMVNDISSILVIGNGRATDLPPIPGRGIWKNSQGMVEIQTPFLSPESAETLLAPHKREDTKEKVRPSPSNNTSESTPLNPVIGRDV